jgi:hypothetical protein
MPNAREKPPAPGENSATTRRLNRGRVREAIGSPRTARHACGIGQRRNPDQRLAVGMRGRQVWLVAMLKKVEHPPSPRRAPRPSCWRRRAGDRRRIGQRRESRPGPQDRMAAVTAPLPPGRRRRRRRSTSPSGRRPFSRGRRVTVGAPGTGLFVSLIHSAMCSERSRVKTQSVRPVSTQSGSFPVSLRRSAWCK